MVTVPAPGSRAVTRSSSEPIRSPCERRERLARLESLLDAAGHEDEQKKAIDRKVLKKRQHGPSSVAQTG